MEDKETWEAKQETQRHQLAIRRKRARRPIGRPKGSGEIDRYVVCPHVKPSLK